MLNIDPINPEIFELLPYVHFFKNFQYKTLRDFLCFQIAEFSIFELEKCSFLVAMQIYKHRCLSVNLSLSLEFIEMLTHLKKNTFLAQILTVLEQFEEKKNL